METHAEPANLPQQSLWNSRVGETWVAQQALLDRMFRPLEILLAAAVRENGASNVLDIGCGTGATSLAIARALAPTGRCTGIDISRPLIEAARHRAATEGVETVCFQLSDAQTHDFEARSFDAITSRFGVMFFDDPIAAFANLRSAATDDARLTLLVWRDKAENPFMTAAERATRHLLPELPSVGPDEPGQFGLADPARIRSVLGRSWRDLQIDPLDIPCTLSRTDLETYAMNMGRVGAMLPDLDDATRDAVSQALNEAFGVFVSGDAARFSLACWKVSARAA